MINLKVVGSRSKKPSFIGQMIMWHEYDKRWFSLYKYIVKGYRGDDEISHIAFVNGSVVYEAVIKGFKTKALIEWNKRNEIIWICNPVETLSLSSTDAREAIAIANELIEDDIPYGVGQLFGIMFNIKTSSKLFVNGALQLICSEAIHTIFNKWLPALTKPIDYITPLDIIRLLKMKRYTII